MGTDSDTASAPKKQSNSAGGRWLHMGMSLRLVFVVRRCRNQVLDFARAGEQRFDATDDLEPGRAQFCLQDVRSKFVRLSLLLARGFPMLVGDQFHDYQ